jgi:large subunit ribosomal protein L35
MAKMKLKSNRSAAKRIKETGSGKFKRQQAGKRHLLSSKNASRRNRLDGSVIITKSNEANIRKLLPYGNR